jgi:cell division septal protein FtsQ
MRKRKSSLPVKPLAGLLLIALVLFFAAISLMRAAKNSGLFRVRDIIAREGNNAISSIDLSFLMGRNILEINLAEEERSIARLYPGYRGIKLVRVLPNRLFVYFIRRRPVAWVKLYRYFYVDDDAVLFDIPADAASLPPELPVISGLESKIFGPKSGRKYNIKELSCAIDIIKAADDNRRLRGMRIKKIDVSNLANVSFIISLPDAAAAPDGIEIKLGQEYIRDKISLLSSLLIQGRNDWKNIKYVDLRFKEAVIKFNDDKKILRATR